MLATISQPTTDESTMEPSVIYHVSERRIEATVIVTHAGGDAPTRIHAPLIAIPGPDPTVDGEYAVWTVRWTLVPGTGVTSAIFAGEGITIPSTNKQFVPERVKVLEATAMQMTGEQTTQWEVTFGNGVTGANSFAYDITTDLTRTVDSKPLRVSHDPTIAVTSDPIDG